MSKKTSNGHAVKGTCLPSCDVCRMLTIQVCAQIPIITRRQYNDDVREVFDVCIGPGNITVICVIGYQVGIGLTGEGKQQICLVIDATGPFSLTTGKARLYPMSLGSHHS